MDQYPCANRRDYSGMDGTRMEMWGMRERVAVWSTATAPCCAKGSTKLRLPHILKEKKESLLLSTQRTDLIRYNQQYNCTNLPHQRVQLPGSHPDEYQWQFTIDAGSENWTDEEMVPIEEALIEHMEPGANATWEFCKMFGKVDVTRLNWHFDKLMSTEEVAPYIHKFYARLSTDTWLEKTQQNAKKESLP